MKSMMNAISLKVLLNLLITALLMLVMLLGAFLLLHNARENVRAEIESTAVLVTHMLDEEILSSRHDRIPPHGSALQPGGFQAHPAFPY